MFGLSLTHIILFGIILLIFVGPEQLPEVARTIARVLNELKRATSDFQSQFTNFEPRPPPPNSQPQQIQPPFAASAPTPPPAEISPEVVEHFGGDEVSPGGHGYPDAPPGEQALPTGVAPVGEKENKS